MRDSRNHRKSAKLVKRTIKVQAVKTLEEGEWRSSQTKARLNSPIKPATNQRISPEEGEGTIERDAIGWKVVKK